jgi:hypothetical protein
MGAWSGFWLGSVAGGQEPRWPSPLPRQVLLHGFCGRLVVLLGWRFLGENCMYVLGTEWAWSSRQSVSYKDICSYCACHKGRD